MADKAKKKKKSVKKRAQAGSKTNHRKPELAGHPITTLAGPPSATDTSTTPAT